MDKSNKVRFICFVVCLVLLSSCVHQTQQVYLENVGNYSAIMTKFIDELLKKVSYLADVVIENSLYENCEPVCPKSSYSIYVNGSKTTVPSIMDRPKQDPTILPAKEPGSCAIFGIEVREEDLPTPLMLTCCKELHQCYKGCGRAKLGCDNQFLSCLNNLCKEKFSETIEKSSTCELSIKVLMIGNLAFGCKEYKQQQSSSCCSSTDQDSYNTASTLKPLF